MKGISTLSIVPVRSEPSDRSEMVSQVLFGELFEIIEQRKNWSHIRLKYDDYTGWIDSKQITFIDDKEAEDISSQPVAVTMDIVQVAINGHNLTPVVMGSSLPFYHEKKFFIGQKEFNYDGQVKILTKPEAKTISQNAYMFLNAPYLWGGRSPFGIDCSGFTQVIFKLSGIPLKRDAWQQGEQGTAVDSVDDSKEGDLAFFKNEDDKVVHTGIVLMNNHIIHASGKVRVDRLDGNGIFNAETNLYSHRLAGIKRYV